MFKFIFVILSISLFSYGKSRVGEWAAYSFIEKTPTSEINGEFIKEVVESIDQKSPTGEVITMLKVSEKKITRGKNVEEKFYWSESTNYFNKIELNLYLQLCRFKSSLGNYEKIKIKAGTFSSCKIKDQNNWIGTVPFSTLLFMTQDETTFRRFELIDYGWKKKK